MSVSEQSRKQNLSKSLVSSLQSQEPEECRSKIRPRWYDVFGSLRKHFVEREVFSGGYSTSYGLRNWRAGSSENESHPQTWCTYSRLEVFKNDFCKSLDAIFRTSCFRIFYYGFATSPFGLNFLRVETLNEMYVSADDVQKRKAEVTAYAIFAYRQLGIDRKIFEEEWDQEWYSASEDYNDDEPRAALTVEEFYDAIPEHGCYESSILDTNVTDSRPDSGSTPKRDTHDFNTASLRRRLLHELFESSDSDSEW
eukprot:gene328-595_t